MKKLAKISTLVASLAFAMLFVNTASADANPFAQADQISTFFGDGDKKEGKCGEGKCGDKKGAKKEGKCGDKKGAKKEGKCGDGKGKKGKGEKKCGEGKCGSK